MKTLQYYGIKKHIKNFDNNRIIMANENIHSKIFNIVRNIQNTNLNTYKIVEYNMIFEKHGDINMIIINNEFTIYNDGTIISKNINPLPLLLLYIGVHVLQTYNDCEFLNRDSIDSLLPENINKTLFWNEELDHDQLHDVWINNYEIVDPVDPGVYMSFQFYGNTISFKDAKNKLLLIENIPRDKKLPICVIKTPNGEMIDKNIFKFEKHQNCEEFLSKLYALIISKYHDYKCINNYNELIITNPEFFVKTYICYTTMNNIEFDHDNKTCLITWNKMASY